MNKKDIRLLKVFLSLLNTEYTDYFISDFFKVHKTSFDSIPLLLSQYDIDSMVVEFKTQQLKDVDFPILILIDDKLLICEKYENNNIHLIAEKGRKIVITKENFESKWKGLAILADASNQSTEPDLRQNKLKQSKKKLLNALSIISFIGLVSLIVGTLYQANKFFLSFFLLNTVGAILSFHLVRLSNGVKTLLTNSICSFSRETSCQKVLISKAANIKGISLADIGLTYFIFLSLLIIIAPSRESYVFIILVISAFAALFSLFSIGYQIKLKTWCPLCLLVVLVLLIDFVLLIFQDPELGSIKLYELLEVMLLGLVTITVWNYAKEKLMIQNMVTSLKANLNAFESDEFIQDQIIGNGYEISAIPNISYLELAKAESNNEIIIITSPLCKPCEKIHEELDGFIEYFKEYVSIKLVPFISDSPSLANTISESFLCLINSNKLELINEWYSLEVKNNETYKKWKSDKHFDDTKETDSTKKWLIENRIDYTPCLIVNGRLVIGFFGLKQIKEYLKRKLN